MERDLNARQAPIVTGELFPVESRPLLVVCVVCGPARGGRRARLYVIDAADIAKQIMARLAVALACAAGVSAFMAPSVTAPAKTVVYGKGGELRDRKLQCWILHGLVAVSPPVDRTIGPAASAAAKLLAPQAGCKKTATKRQNAGRAETSESQKNKISRAWPRAATRRRAVRSKTGAPRRDAPRRAER